jgi:hypothetical protein
MINFTKLFKDLRAIGGKQSYTHSYAITRVDDNAYATYTNGFVYCTVPVAIPMETGTYDLETMHPIATLLPNPSHFMGLAYGETLALTELKELLSSITVKRKSGKGQALVSIISYGETKTLQCRVITRQKSHDTLVFNAFALQTLLKLHDFTHLSVTEDGCIARLSAENDPNAVAYIAPFVN